MNQDRKALTRDQIDRKLKNTVNELIGTEKETQNTYRQIVKALETIKELKNDRGCVLSESEKQYLKNVIGLFNKLIHKNILLEGGAIHSIATTLEAAKEEGFHTDRIAANTILRALHELDKKFAVSEGSSSKIQGYMDSYKIYIKLYRGINDFWIELKKKYHEEFRDKEKEVQFLNNGLIKPAQRLPRFEILLNDIVKKTPSSVLHDSLKHHLKKLKWVLHEIYTQEQITTSASSHLYFLYEDIERKFALVPLDKKTPETDLTFVKVTKLKEAFHILRSELTEGIESRILQTTRMESLTETEKKLYKILHKQKNTLSQDERNQLAKLKYNLIKQISHEQEYQRLLTEQKLFEDLVRLQDHIPEGIDKNVIEKIRKEFKEHIRKINDLFKKNHRSFAL